MSDRHRLRNAVAAAVACIGLGFAAAPVAADEPTEFLIVIENHEFHPAELEVPAGKRIKLVVENRDPSPEEFESHDLRREKIVPGGSKVGIWVGPLPAGRYGFFGEFNEATAQGALIAK